jgi:6-phosphogluconolactonase
MSDDELRFVDAPEQVATAAARLIVDAARDAHGRSGRWTLALAGGTTPRHLYHILATPPVTGKLPWPATHVFWTDERHVGPDDPASNFRMAEDELLRHVPVPRPHIHRIQGEDHIAERAASMYDAELRATLDVAPGDFAVFDIMLLGMGADGHTASLFPGSSAVHERARQVVAPWVRAHGTFRITITPPVIERARLVVVLVTGQEKGEALRAALNAPTDTDRTPIHCVRAATGRVVWLIDAAARRAAETTVG